MKYTREEQKTILKALGEERTKLYYKVRNNIFRMEANKTGV